MRIKFLLIASVLIFEVSVAQNGAATLSMSQGTAAAPAPASPSVAVTEPASSASPETTAPARTSILDYESVYEAPTLEQEVKMATERFELTPNQQEVWMNAAVDRRQSEKFAREKLETKDPAFEKEGIYRGLRSAQNTFYETIIGYLTPNQKHAFENDRLILQEKQKKIAKMPPAPPTPTVTVAPVDSSAVKEPQAGKKKSKKSKKKKSPVMQ